MLTLSPSTQSSLRISLIYVVFAALWIAYSDLIVSALVTEPQSITRIQTFKGWFFVAIVGLLLYVLSLKNYHIVERAFQLDSLTGLLNHNMFKAQLERRIASLPPGKRLLLGFMDIDHFKELNQSLGFERADKFLLQLARDIEAFALSDAIIARFPPDQFVSAREFDPNDDIDLRVRGYQSLFGLTAQRMGIKATCSIGVAIYPDDGDTAKKLMDAATEALEGAKRQGNTTLYHDKALTELALKRRQLLADLKAALASQSLSLAYQPKYAIDTGIVKGVEVLIRWRHPMHGFVRPDEFIPLAEESGLSPDISQFVITRAAYELQSSGLLGNPLGHVAINVSASEFNHPEQMDEILQAIKRCTALAPYVRIEITETATLHDMRQSTEIINKLRSEGLTFSIDDFGTGYTSLAMLKDFTIDEIKIDRSFVSDIERDVRSRTIVDAIIGMAESFGINVVAEGVETQTQLEALKAMGCNEAQGYLLGKPMDIGSLVDHLKR